MPDYRSNSHKDKEKEAKREAKVKQVIDKVVTGEVIEKQKGPGRKFKDLFFGGDAQHAAKFVAADVLLPALRNLVVDMVTKGAERLIYGENNVGRRPPNFNYSSRYQVSGPRQDNRVIDLIGGQRQFPPSPRGRQNRHDMNDIIVSTREEADLVIERLGDVLSQYDVVSLSDLYELLGLETSHIDSKWGWTNLTGAQVRQIRQGYLLELPPLEEI